MNYRRQLGLLILNMTTVSLVVAGIGIYTIYRTAFEEQKEWLKETAQSQARIIEAIASQTDNPETALETFAQGYEKFKGLAHTGEITLAKRDNNQIIFLIPPSNPVSWQDSLSEPMRRALSGQSGIILGPDYRGVQVLAAYEPVAQLNWGIVAKIELAEIRTPFLIATVYTIIAALIVDLLGAILFLGISNSMVQRLEENEALSQAIEELQKERNFISNILDTTSSLIIVLNREGKIIRFNRACEIITHYSFNEVEGKNFGEVFLKLQPLEIQNFIARLETSQFPQQQESIWLTKERELRTISWSNRAMFNQEEILEYIIITGIDISERVLAQEKLTQLNQQLEDKVQARTRELQNSNEQLHLENLERQRLEDAWRREIDLLARIMETSPVGIMMVNSNGNVILASDQAEQILKLSLVETEHPYNLLTWKIFDEQGNSISVNELPFQQVMRTGESLSAVRYSLELLDGRQILLSLNSSPLFNAEEQIEGVVLTIENITERVQVETALIHREAQFRAIFEQAAVGIFQIALTGQYILVNDKFVDIVQYSAAELQDKSFQEITYDDDLEQEIIYIGQMLKDEIDNFCLEKRYLRQDNSLVWVNLSASIVRNHHGEPRYLIGIVEDISDRKKAIEALCQSEEKYRRIIETTTEGVWILDDHNQTTFVNHRMAQMLGYSIEEMKDRSLFDFIISEDYALADLNLERRRQGIAEQHDFKFLRKDGTYLWTMISTNPIYDYSGKYIGTLGMLSDITERKKTEEMLQKLNEELTARVEELEQRNQDILLLNQVNDFLQACLNSEEAYQVISELIKPLFPGCSGGLFLLNNSKNLIEAVATWGDNLSSKPSFTFNECWALRRGYIHWAKPTQPSLICPHTHPNSTPIETLCVPMIAQGQAVGLFYLTTSQSEKLSEVKQQLARAVSEHISLALVNLQLRESLETQSIKDSLTQLYNRRYMEESLKRELNLAKRKQHSVGLIMIDVDHFKQFNDNFGHKAGDLVLQEVSHFLMNNVRSGDIACRYGGEEFLLILPEAYLSDSEQRAEQLRQGIKQLSFKYYNQSLNSITISLGIASFPEHGDHSEVLINAADTALYQAKKRGRDRVVIFSPSIHL